MLSDEKFKYSSLFQSENCDYTPNYCEENIYLLCQKYIQDFSQKKLPLNEKEDAYAVFITNPTQKTFIQYQKNSLSKNNLVVWDYHVIFIHKVQANEKNFSYVYDFDSILPFPCEFKEYYSKALSFEVYGKLPTYFRVCKAQEFLNEFASDRSHMLKDKKKSGLYKSPPPKYSCIVNKKKENMNLHSFLNLRDEICGQVMDEKELNNFFS